MHPIRTPGWKTAAIAAGAVLLTLPAIAAGLKRFPHAPHADGPACSACHAPAGERAGMPGAAACAECHDEPTGVDLAAATGRARTAPVRFSHAAHEGLDCADCHGLPSGDRMAIPDADRCLACHRENEVASGCAACHASARFRPTGHDAAWLVQHGRSGRAGGDPGHGGDCSLCHPDNSCRACHRVTRPRDHTGFFRTRGHGTAAGIDRDGCATCHTADYCLRCHREARPAGHRGAWRQTHARIGAGDLARCGVCHLPGETAHCAGCHRTGR